MIESFIGRPGGKLRRWLRAVSFVGATALSVFAGSMMLATAPAAAAGPPEFVGEIVPAGWPATFETRVEAVVTPNEQSTECHVQYGHTTVTEHEVACEQATIDGTEQVVAETLTGLAAETEYKYQFVLKNVADEEVTGKEEPFTTAVITPPAIFGPAYLAWVTTLKAHIEVIADAENQESECHVQYGEVSVTENEVPCEQASLTLPSEPRAVSVTLSGLHAKKTYKYRFALKNTSGEEGLGEVEELTTAPAELPKILSETTAWTGAFEARPEATVNPDNQDSECFLQYGTTAVTENELPCEQATIEVPSGEQGVGLTLKGLAAGTTYKYSFLLKNTSGEDSATDEAEFTTDPKEKPKVISQSSSVHPTEATLSAEVNPEGQVTECHVYYGESSVTENEAPCEPEKLEAPYGQSTVNVTVTGLQSATPYHFQFVLKNGSGEEGTGREEEFETVFPVSEIETGAAREVTSTSAELTGRVNAGGEAAYYFEYGTLACIPGPPASCGERVDEVNSIGKLQEAVAGKLEFLSIGQLLKPDTTYHYWLAADNSLVGEPIHGEAREFTTLDVPPSQIDAGEVEEITTTSAVINGEINPGGHNATFYLEYGTAQCSATSCGQKTTEVPVTGKSQQAITPVTLTGLTPNTVYHFWLAVDNDGVSEPVHGQADAFKTEATPAELAAEKAAEEAANTQAGAEAAAAKSKSEEETRHREEAVAALTAAQNKKYNEINAVLAASKLQEEALARTEAIIADTSVKIVKTKVNTGSVVITVKVSQAGNVAVTGTGLQKKTAKLSVGTHTITVKLTKAGKADRKGHKKANITATLDTSLTSVASSTSIRL
jgi:hypothetical protein